MQIFVIQLLWICVHGFVFDNFGTDILLLEVSLAMHICSVNNCKPTVFVLKKLQYWMLHNMNILFTPRSCSSILRGIQSETAIFTWTRKSQNDFCSFYATVCKMVRPVLSDRCLSSLSCLSLSCLSVTLAYNGQMVGRIKMKLGMQVGLRPGHIVLCGNPTAPPQRGIAPNFRPISASVQATLC